MKMQSQFDEWYSNLHSRNMIPSDAHTSIENRDMESQSSWIRPGSNQLNKSLTSTSDQSNDRTSPPTYVSKVNKLPRSTESDTKPMASYMNSRSSDYSSNSELSRAESKSSNQGMSNDDVNEDIMAFYQAKEELLKRRKS